MIVVTNSWCVRVGVWFHGTAHQSSFSSPRHLLHLLLNLLHAMHIRYSDCTHISEAHRVSRTRELPSHQWKREHTLFNTQTGQPLEKTHMCCLFSATNQSEAHHFPRPSSIPPPRYAATKAQDCQESQQGALSALSQAQGSRPQGGQGPRDGHRRPKHHSSNRG